jgi:hypothetical protein
VAVSVEVEVREVRERGWGGGVVVGELWSGGASGVEVLTVRLVGEVRLWGRCQCGGEGGM